MRSTSGYVNTYNASQVIADLPAGTLNYHDTNVVPGTTYYYTLMTYDDSRVYSQPVDISFTTEGTASNNTSSGSTGTFADGKLLLDSGVIYIMEYGQKRPFANMTAFSGFGFKLANVTRTDTSGIALGSGIFTANQRHTRGVLVNSNGTIYFMGATQRLPFPSASVFLSWSNEFKNVVAINQSDLAVPAGPPIQMKPASVLGVSTLNIKNGMLVKYPNNPTVYLYNKGMIQPFASAKALTKRGYSFSQINTIDFHSIPIGAALN